jgi:hypothetical protein
MKKEKNISGVSENLSDSIGEKKTTENNLHQGKLYGKRIAISVSESEELEQIGMSEQHIKDISIEISRYLMVNGATMLYGGDLRKDGYTELFSELSYQYKYLKDRERRFVNYFSFPNSKSLSVNARADFIMKQVEPKILTVPKHLGKIDLEKEYDAHNDIKDKFVVAECLTDMRKRMATESNARIVLGGRLKNFSGYYPGIVEETYLSLKASKAVYLLGGFGGAAKSLCEIITGSKSNKLTNKYQYDTKFLKDFRKYASDKSKVKLDYGIIVKYFEQNTLESISKKNGLTPEENQILFESTNIHELVFLIIKGLQNIFRIK